MKNYLGGGKGREKTVPPGLKITYHTTVRGKEKDNTGRGGVRGELAKKILKKNDFGLFSRIR